MKTSALLSVSCAKISTASALEKVLAPDNEGAPRGLLISMSREKSAIHLTVESDSPSTTISTCLGLLRDIGLFGEVWLLTQGRNAPVRG